MDNDGSPESPFSTFPATSPFGKRLRAMTIRNLNDEFEGMDSASLEIDSEALELRDHSLLLGQQRERFENEMEIDNGNTSTESTEHTHEHTEQKRNTLTESV